MIVVKNKFIENPLKKGQFVSKEKLVNQPYPKWQELTLEQKKIVIDQAINHFGIEKYDMQFSIDIDEECPGRSLDSGRVINYAIAHFNSRYSVVLDDEDIYEPYPSPTYINKQLKKMAREFHCLCLELEYCVASAWYMLESRV